QHMQFQQKAVTAAGGSSLRGGEPRWRNGDLCRSLETLLHVAATNGHLAIMEYLISKGAKPDVKDKKGRTPLHRAAEKGHGDAVKVLLRCASVNAKDRQSKSPLHYASEKGDKTMVEMLLNANADPNVLCRIKGEGSPSVVVFSK
uniref:Uncharacterized protein n=1 Tax=Anser brachyrhynchus TaxID=132585 RepID=A0A8B9CYI1_9AVES